MPFWASASSRSDAPRDPRPARAFAVWDHDPEGDAFVPPPPDTLPASLRPPRSNDAWLLDAGSCAGLVRRGRHAPARDGSESPDVRRLRVRLAQLEPVLDDARRDARLADRARRTAEAERDRARAALAAARRDASEAIEEARAASEAARVETKTAREETRAFRDERDALKRSAAVFEAEAIRREKETEAALAEMERRLREREREVVDAGTETASDSFGDASDEERVAAEIRSATRDAYEAGSRDGERRGREATLEASAAARLLAEAARDAAHARAADAEARVATLAARLERARANEAAERKRAAAAEARRNEHETLSRLKASAAADALAAAETREGVFRARLEALARNPPLVANGTEPRTEREPTGPPVGSFFCDARRAPAKTSPEDQKKKPSSFASSFARVETRAKTPKREKGNPGTPFAKKRAALKSDDHLSSEEPRDENARSLREEKEKQGELPDWLPEVRPPPRMLA